MATKQEQIKSSQWAMKAFLKGYLHACIRNLIMAGLSRDEAVDFVIELVELHRPEELFENDLNNKQGRNRG